MTSWQKFTESYVHLRDLEFALDYSRVQLPEGFFKRLSPNLGVALRAMDELEAGAIANPDEQRMVGHYWLRAPEKAPSSDIRDAIISTLMRIKEFARKIHNGEIKNAGGESYKHLLVVGIGGSALGPQFVSQALRTPHDPLDLYFFDNTDPDGMQRVLDAIPSLAHTLVCVISKSGGTKETRNGQLIAKAAFSNVGLSVQNHFIAVTGEGSELDKTALTEKWLVRFPMWDWVGGRTSEFSAVGILPAALQGFDIDAMLEGARRMDEATRVHDAQKNPALLLAALWYHLGNGRGEKDMVVLPYSDRLELFSRYLQQLVMESLGKEHDLSGKVVNQGIAVYGNKGSTDQHAYVQQLRDGVPNFFAVFVHVLRDGPVPHSANKFEVEPGVTAGDYLTGFYLGTRQALIEKNRESISITIGEATAREVGMLIALFERAVGYYASLVNINAYHQPGVEAGKKAAGQVLDWQRRVADLLTKQKGQMTAHEIARALGAESETETIFHILRHLSANGRIRLERSTSVFEDRYSSL